MTNIPNVEQLKDEDMQGLTSIAAVTENRGTEVGIAIYTQFKQKITLAQIVDNELYT